MSSSEPENRVVVGISGGGRSLDNFLKRADRHQYNICGVISSSRTCLGVQIATTAKLPVFYGKFTPENLRQTSKALYEWLAELGVDWIALAGFLKPFPLAEGWSGRVINIHPALLPKFGGQGMFGLNVHKAVLAKKEKESGASVHLVSERYDEGPILAQVKVAVRSQDTPEDLAKKVFAAECDLYPQVLDDLITKKLSTAKPKVKIYEF